MNSKKGWQHDRQKVKVSGKIKEGARVSAIMTSKPKKKAAKKELPAFDKKAFLKEALPIFAIEDKKTIEVAIRMAEHGLAFADYGPAPQIVLLLLDKSATLAELRAKLHLAIKELTKVMELTM